MRGSINSGDEARPASQNESDGLGQLTAALQTSESPIRHRADSITSDENEMATGRDVYAEAGPIISRDPKQVNIESLSHGFIVTIGCQKFAVESVDKLVKNLAIYLKNPSDTEDKWFKDKTLID